MRVSDVPEQAAANPHAPPTPIGGLLRSGLGQSVRLRANAEVKHLSLASPACPVKSRIAESPAQALLAQNLVRRRYYRAGYRMVEDDGCPFPAPSRAPKYFPIVALQAGRVVGTVTVGVDSPAGLMVDDTHKGTADSIRLKGGRLCELVRLAIEADVDSKRVLASLLQCVYATCTTLFDLTDVVIEVIPKHVSFYCRHLGFTRASEIRLCERVGGVPSMVLSLERAELERRLRALSLLQQRAA